MSVVGDVDASTVAGVDLVAERSRLGGLEQWLADPSVSEVLVNAGSEVWVERSGVLARVGTMRSAAVLAALEQILAPIGRRLDRASPTVDARLLDGSRVCAAIPPVAVDGPTVAIRRFAVRPVPLGGFAAPAVVELLSTIVERRCNVVVSGQTSSGKTTLLNALAARVARRRAAGHAGGRRRAAPRSPARGPTGDPTGDAGRRRRGAASPSCCAPRCGCVPIGW